MPVSLASQKSCRPPASFLRVRASGDAQVTWERKVTQALANCQDHALGFQIRWEDREQVLRSPVGSVRAGHVGPGGRGGERGAKGFQRMRPEGTRPGTSQVEAAWAAATLGVGVGVVSAPHPRPCSHLALVAWGPGHGNGFTLSFFPIVGVFPSFPYPPPLAAGARIKTREGRGPGRRAPSPAPQLSQSLARIGFRKQAGGAWQVEGHVRGLGHRSQSPEPGPLNRALEMRAVGTAGAEPLLARPCCLFPPGTDASLCHGVLVPFTDGKAEAQGGWGVTRPLTHSRQEAELRCEPSSVWLRKLCLVVVCFQWLMYLLRISRL